MKFHRNKALNKLVLAAVVASSYAVIPAVAQDITDDVTAVLNQVNPSAWSKFGWGRFKWNMAPGDIQLVLGKRIGIDQVAVQRDAKGNPRWITVVIDDVEFYGGKEVAALKFVDARLISIDLQIDCGEGPPSKAICDQKYAKIADRLGKEFGTGLCEKKGTSATVCQWDKKNEVWIQGYKAQDIAFVHFEYSTPEDKLFRFSFSANDARVPSASWGPSAWANFRWGMGFEDVIAAAKSGTGTIKLKSGLNCLRDEKSGEIICKAKSGTHEFKVGDFRPDIQFRFKGRRLARVDLLQRSEDMPIDWKEYQRPLRLLLTEKYGAPIDVFEGSSYQVFRWKQESTEIRLNGSSHEVAVTYVDTQSKADALPNAGGGL